MTRHVQYKIGLSILIIIALSALSGCVAQKAGTKGVESSSQNAGLTLTLEELRKYNGRNGNPAYIAVNGVIYDVTNVSHWRGGYHNGFYAGNDLTSEIKFISPHGVPRLAGVPVVGRLVD